jgi:hypothetical protein
MTEARKAYLAGDKKKAYLYVKILKGLSVSDAEELLKGLSEEPADADAAPPATVMSEIIDEAVVFDEITAEMLSVWGHSRRQFPRTTGVTDEASMIQGSLLSIFYNLSVICGLDKNPTPLLRTFMEAVKLARDPVTGECLSMADPGWMENTLYPMIKESLKDNSLQSDLMKLI